MGNLPSLGHGFQEPQRAIEIKDSTRPIIYHIVPTHTYYDEVQGISQV